MDLDEQQRPWGRTREWLPVLALLLTFRVIWDLSSSSTSQISVFTSNLPHEMSQFLLKVNSNQSNKSYSGSGESPLCVNGI